MANELTLHELESEMAIELPEREALNSVSFNIWQKTTAVNVQTSNSTTFSNNTFAVIQLYNSPIVVAYP